MHFCFPVLVLNYKSVLVLLHHKIFCDLLVFHVDY